MRVGLEKLASVPAGGAAPAAAAPGGAAPAAAEEKKGKDAIRYLTLNFSKRFKYDEYLILSPSFD